MVPITVMGYECGRCGHRWVSRGPYFTPKKCPKCGSYRWETPAPGAPSPDAVSPATESPSPLDGQPL